MKKKFDFNKKDLWLVVIISLTLLICNYVLLWHSVYKEHNLNISVLSELLNEVSGQEFESYIVENPNTFIYMKLIDDLETKEFEKEFKRTINRYFLKDKVIYVNTKDIDLNLFLKPYDVNEKNIDKFPVIVYFEDGIVYDYINKGNNKMDNKSIVRFFRMYGEI